MDLLDIDNLFDNYNSDSCDSSDSQSDSISESFYYDQSDEEKENFDNDWHKNFELFIGNDYKYKDNCGSKLEMNENSMPIEFFNKFFTNEIFELIVCQTNIYGKQKLLASGDCKGWQDIKIDEIKAFIGINILMGIKTLPSYVLYWKKDSTFYTPTIANIMSRDKFTMILTNIHLENNSLSQKNDKLYKIRNFLNILRNNFISNYTLNEYVSVDESLIKFKGRSTMKQYMPLKHTKRGYKNWVLADSFTGYVYNFNLYTGKDTTRTEKLGEHVVKNLVETLHYTNIHLFFDNFYTTDKLLYDLKKLGIKATGTVRPSRSFIPKNFITINKMKQGESDYICKNGISLVKWMDKKIVYSASNFYDPNDITSVTRKNKKGELNIIKCPKLIAEYNKFMGGVDKSDQLLAPYSIDRKSKRWWLRIFFHFMNISLVNAFICYKDHCKNTFASNLTLLEFLSSVAHDLIGNNSFRKKRGRPESSGQQPKKLSKLVRYENVGIHIPKPSNRMRCAYCYEKYKKEQKTKIICKTCKVGLCVAYNRNCFELYHIKPNN